MKFVQITVKCDGFRRDLVRVVGKIGDPSDTTVRYATGRTWLCSLPANHEGECLYDR